MILGLFVGINDYPGVDADLGGCVDDAQDWAAYFSKHLNATPVMLLNEGATKDRIVDRLRAGLAAVGAGDTFVFTYSGHGTWMPDLDGDEPDGRDEAFCPFDMSETNLLLDDEMHEILSDRNPKSRVLMITDSCHSGTVSRMVGVPGEKRRIRYLPPANFVKDPLTLQHIAMRSVRLGPTPTNKALPGVVHFAGCGDREYCYDAQFGGKPNGAFTRTMLDVMAGKTQIPTYGDLIKAVKKKLPSYEYPQTPRLNVSRTLRNTPFLG